MKKVICTTTPAQKAANALIKHFKTPAGFLSFISWEISHADDFERKYGKLEANVSVIFDLMLWIEEVVQRWFEGEGKIAEGIEKMAMAYGHEGHHRLVSYLYMAYGNHWDPKTFDYWTNAQEAKKSSAGIDVMRELGVYIYLIRVQWDKEREARSVSKIEQKPAKRSEPKKSKVAA